MARVKSWEVDKRGEVPAGQVPSIAAGSVAAQVGRLGTSSRLLGGYAVLAGETPAVVPAPAPLVRPEVDEGPHLAYTVQWYAFAVTALVVWVVAGRRELESRRAAAAEDLAAADDARLAGEVAPREGAEDGDARQRSRGRRVPARRGGDEAAEDAEVEASQLR